jgi:hypothetical protein
MVEVSDRRETPDDTLDNDGHLDQKNFADRL